MKLSAKLKESVVSEIRLASSQMKIAQRPLDKIYFFSAVFGVTNRVMNIEFDPELAFVHHVTNACYNLMTSSLLLISQGQMTNTITPEVFSKIEAILDELALNIEKGESTYQTLESLSNTTYIMSGNGYYLYLKKIIKL